MSPIFDQLGRLAQQTAAEARERATEAKLRLDLRGIDARLDDRAQALGRLVFRQSQGEAVADEDLAKVIGEMKAVMADRKAKEAELEALRQSPAKGAPPTAPAGEGAAPPTPPAEPEAAAETATQQPAASADDKPEGAS